MANSETIIALKANGEPWAWGLGLAIGDNTTNSKSSPVSVVGEHKFIKVSAGGTTFAGGLKADKTLWTWGVNASGQLGQNNTTNRSSPVSVIGGHTFEDFSFGDAFWIAIKSDGTCWSCGENGWGQLGDLTTTDKSSPISVVGAHSFIKVAAGKFHSLALKANGEVWAWGRNHRGVSTPNGQLGDNTGTDSSSPVLVVGSHSFIEIKAGDEHSLARKETGDVWAWGNNNSRQLGDGTNTNRSSPVSVVGAHSFIGIAAGGHSSEPQGSSYGLKTTGDVWAWGANTWGQLGDLSATQRSSPVSVVGAHSFIGIAAGQMSCFGRKSDGSVWSWGNGADGRLGNWSTSNQSSPVAVVGTV